MLIDTSENYYELAWAVRDAIFTKIIGDGGGDLHGILDEFSDFECSHQILLETRNGRLEELNLNVAFLTGNAKILPLPEGASPGPKAVELDDILKRVELLAGFVRDGGFDTVVELGAGYGLNLFRLHHALGNPPLRYIAAEYTESGRRLCDRLAKLDGSMAVETAFINHKQPDLGFLKSARKALIFTCHSIEQVARIPDDYFAVLAAAAPEVLGVHFEPFGFQVACDRPLTRRQKEFFDEKHWNGNLHACLRAAEAAGTITVRDVELECFAAQSDNPTSLAVWEKPGV